MKVLQLILQLLFLPFLVLLRSLREEHEREKKVRAETEESLKEIQEAKKSLQAKSKEIITALKEQVEELTATKVNFFVNNLFIHLLFYYLHGMKLCDKF